MTRAQMLFSIQGALTAAGALALLAMPKALLPITIIVVIVTLTPTEFVWGHLWRERFLPFSDFWPKSMGFYTAWLCAVAALSLGTAYFLPHAMAAIDVERTVMAAALAPFLWWYRKSWVHCYRGLGNGGL